MGLRARVRSTLSALGSSRDMLSSTRRSSAGRSDASTLAGTSPSARVVSSPASWVRHTWNASSCCACRSRVVSSGEVGCAPLHSELPTSEAPTDCDPLDSSAGPPSVSPLDDIGPWGALSRSPLPLLPPRSLFFSDTGRRVGAGRLADSSSGYGTTPRITRSFSAWIAAASASRRKNPLHSPPIAAAARDCHQKLTAMVALADET
mmetsp:Transcript_39812/g.94558  ORF Transcript_39812/g.94558 Transcript_39812/m.94558 type:complete len:205 (+) Transcript_39812:473-1087(+)